MEIFKRADGRSPYWLADLTDPRDGKRKRLSLKVKGSRSDAEKAARRLLAEWEQEVFSRAGERPGISLQEALDAYGKWLEAHGKVAAGGIKRLCSKAVGGMAGHWGLPAEMVLHDLTPALIEKLVLARLHEGNGPQTIAHEIKAIRAATRYAAGMGKRSPVDMLNGTIKDAWRLPKVAQKTRYLTPEEFGRVYAYMDPQRPIEQTRGSVVSCGLPGGSTMAARQAAQDLLVALAMCGGRWSEVAALDWAQVDTNALAAWGKWSGGQADAPRPVVLVRIWGTKTAASRERIIGASDQMCAMLWRRWRSVGTPKRSLIFPGKGGDARSGTCRAILRAMDRCGLNDAESVARHGRATVHSLRHTFASLLVQNGASIAEVQDALGHASLAMTRRYAHLSKADSAARLGSVMTSAMGTLSAHQKS